MFLDRIQEESDVEAPQAEVRVPEVSPEAGGCRQVDGSVGHGKGPAHRLRARSCGRRKTILGGNFTDFPISFNVFQ